MTDDLKISSKAALVYEEEFVPAIFAQWAQRLVAVAELESDNRVLDVGCGTGILAREAAIHVGDDGLVTGLDNNAGMLEVAGDIAPGIHWQRGDAVKLPFSDASFDDVLSQFALMFVSDRIAALREMWRVLASKGSLVVAVWSDSPVYEALAQYCRGEGIDQVAESFEAFFKLSDAQEIEKLAQEAGISKPKIETRNGIVRFASVDDFVRVEISGWVLGDSIDETAYALLKARAEQEVAPYRDDDGAIAFPMNAHILTANKVG